MSKTEIPSILLSSVPIGLGHMRAAQPINEATHGEVVVASTLGSEEEKKLWSRLRSRYELLSRITSIPFFSHFSLKLLDTLQDIPPLGKEQDLSKPTLQVKILAEMIQMGLGKQVVKRAKKLKLPFVTTFYALAIAADKARIKPVFCIIPDAQVNRAWVTLDPKSSNIIYFVPLSETKKRLEAYGVDPENIYVTGFPLPKENVENAEEDFKKRLKRLDLAGLGSSLPLNLLFSIGGAGAQAELAIKLVKAMVGRLSKGRVRISLFAGIRQPVQDYFTSQLKSLGLTKFVNEGKLRIYHERNFTNYFHTFNKVLRTTDIFFTKPSELSFFTALGLPMCLTPAIGPHECYNRNWLLRIGAGIDWREAIANFDQHLTSGRFIQAARNGFTKASREGTKNICQLIKRLS